MSPWPFVGRATGRNGAVLYVHGPDLWSSVFPIEPFTGLILVCADDLDDTCMQLYDDSPDTREAVEDFHTDVALSLVNRRDAIGSGFLPPDPEPLPARHDATHDAEAPIDARMPLIGLRPTSPVG